MCGELGEKGRDKVTQVLFVDVSEIKVKIRHRGLTGIAHGFHIFDDRRTGERQATQLSFTRALKAVRTKVCSCRSQLQIRNDIRWRLAEQKGQGTRLP